jgi:hypothetical protein
MAGYAVVGVVGSKEVAVAGAEQLYRAGKVRPAENPMRMEEEDAKGEK